MPAKLVSIIYSLDSQAGIAWTAVRRLSEQTYLNWELVCIAEEAVSLDAPALVDVDCRIRFIKSPSTDSRASALNVGIREAKGELVTYFDPEAELVPDFLERAIAFPESFDVLAARFDVALYDKSVGKEVSRTWDPGEQGGQLFARNITKLFAVIHRKELIERSGGFHELLAGEADWDLLKRFARAGADFVFVKWTAGTLRLANSGHAGRGLTARQLDRIEDNRKERLPVFGTQSGWMFPRRVERILFASVHCLLDYTNGASLAVLQAMQWLNENGFGVEAFCLCDHIDPGLQHSRANWLVNPIANAYIEKPIFPDNNEFPTSTHLASRSPSMPELGQGAWETVLSGIPVTVRNVPHNDMWTVSGETREFLSTYEELLSTNRPDVIVTYGGDCLSMAMMEAGKHRDIPIVFWLHNFSYWSPATFQFVDRAIVPSNFCRDWYWDHLGLDCCTLPNFMNWNRVQAHDRQARYVTFVNPEPVKGGFVFAGIARELERRRPEIPLLVVEGRTSGASLKEFDLDLERFSNVTIRRRTADPRGFYAESKLVLMPSLWNESFGLVAAEAMINGIPVIASDRGALPEVVGDGGILLNIPVHYTPETREIPTAQEVDPWVAAIIDLWDDPDRYEAASDRARARAEQWRPEFLGPRFAEFFANISPQPAPPIVPR